MATEAQTEAQGGAAGLDELAEFNDILKQTIKPRSEVAAKEVDNAVSSLVKQAMGDQTLIAGDAIDTIDAILAQRIDTTQEKMK